MHFPTTTLILSGLTLALAQSTTPVPDKPVTFFASLYNTTSDCTGPAKAYLGSAGNCVNIPTSGSGSGKMRVGAQAVNFLSGWTGPDCTGTVVVVQGIVGECQDLGGNNVLSWSNDDKPFGR